MRALFPHGCSLPSFRSADGFTLPELLVVTLVIGILAAIALPAFAGQADRADDAAAKSNTASLASLIEQCNVEAEDFRACDSDSELGGATGVPIGGGIGQVEIVQATRETYRLRGRSRSTATYTVHRPASGAQQRSCQPRNRGGCPPGGDW